MEKSWLCTAKTSSSLAHRTPDSVWCPKLLDSELAALGNRPGDMAKIHRTVRWCTGLSRESSALAPEVFGDELVALGNSSRMP
jgi:hypothetical protein